jgi:membrane fusion protein (multidrug efflux system)
MAKNDGGKPLLTAKQTFVTVGERRGNQIAVLSGINEGDEIVTSGQLKLQNGSRVNINNTVQPSNNPMPNLVDE